MEWNVKNGMEWNDTSPQDGCCMLTAGYPCANALKTEEESCDQKRVAAGFAFVTPEARALVSVPVYVNKRRAPRSVLELRGALTEYE